MRQFCKDKVGLSCIPPGTPWNNGYIATGAWQVSGRSNLCWDESIRLHLAYEENWSMGTNLLIVLKTVPAVLKRDGTN